MSLVSPVPRHGDLVHLHRVQALEGFDQLEVAGRSHVNLSLLVSVESEPQSKYICLVHTVN